MKCTNLLWEKIKDIKVAMLVTVTQEGGYHSRPMATVQEEYNGRLHFFTQSTAPKVDEILHEPRVLLNYTMPEESIYVAVYGEARIIEDRKLIHDLWSPFIQAYFRDGETDPELCLIEVEVVRAEYWDAGKNKMIQIE
jgi:general stress protein 26